MDGGQRTRRRHDQYFIHGFALGGVGRDGVAVGKGVVIVRNYAAIGQQNSSVLRVPAC